MVLVALIKMLPDGIRVIPLFNNVRHCKIEEFQLAIPAFEEKIAELVQDNHRGSGVTHDIIAE